MSHRMLLVNKVDPNLYQYKVPFNMHLLYFLYEQKFPTRTHCMPNYASQKSNHTIKFAWVLYLTVPFQKVKKYRQGQTMQRWYRIKG